MRGRHYKRHFSVLAIVLTGAFAFDSAGGYQQPASASAPSDTPPRRLSETGLFSPGTRQVAPGVLPYSPRYSLWSDGASKRRWMRLPQATAIDATDNDTWEFPVGVRFWKEFGYGRPVETRFIERLADGSWQYATYVWDADGLDASLAPAGGVQRLAVADAPDGVYPIPSRDDCRACHEGTAIPVLGVSFIQLTNRPDPAGATPEPGMQLDVDGLVGRGLIVNFAKALNRAQPTSPALGYLHANCGHCHNDRGPLADIGLDLALKANAGAGALATAVDRVADTTVAGNNVRIVSGHPERSQLVTRMRSRNPNDRMPPLGTRLVDEAALQLVEQWIQSLPTLEGETS